MTDFWLTTDILCGIESRPKREVHILERIITAPTEKDAIIWYIRILRQSLLRSQRAYKRILQITLYIGTYSCDVVHVPEIDQRRHKEYNCSCLVGKRPIDQLHSTVKRTEYLMSSVECAACDGLGNYLCTLNYPDGTGSNIIFDLSCELCFGAGRRLKKDLLWATK
jgi:hypothetical protein